MIVKPAIGFLTKDPNAKLGVSIDTITTGMTNNPAYPATDSGIAEVITLNTEFKQATIDAVGGGVVLTAIRNTKRANLINRVRLLALYVEMTCQGDMDILLSSGFTAQKTDRTPSAVLPAPRVLSIKPGANSGTVALKLEPQEALIYNWRCYLASAPGQYTLLPQTSSANALFPELTPGLMYCFQGNSVNSAGTSDWSVPYSQIVL
ncbi:MAG: hypothetical protein ABIT76_06715 [Chthoniobacterales bacterium]